MTYLRTLIVLFTTVCTFACVGPANDVENVEGQDVYIFVDDLGNEQSSDVFDIDDQVVRFSSNNELLFVSEGLAFSGWSIRGDSLSSPFGDFRVVFGRVDGQARAYFTEEREGTICDIEVGGDVLRITPTGNFVPFESD